MSPRSHPSHLAPRPCAALPARPASRLRRLVAACGCAAALACASLAGAAGLPDPLRVVYTLARGPLEIGRVEETLTRSAAGYHIVSEASAVGVAAIFARGQHWRRESRGRLGADGPRPELYTDQRGHRPVLTIRFDWDAMQIEFERDGTRDTQELPAGPVHDRLSLAWSFALRPPGWERHKTLTVHLADGRSIAEQVYAVLGRERLATPIGELDTIRLSRVREERQPGVDLWVAPGHGMLPVRILVTEPDGQVFEQRIVQISP